MVLENLKLDWTIYMNEKKNNTKPNAVGSAAKLVTPLPDAPDPLWVTIEETISG